SVTLLTWTGSDSGEIFSKSREPFRPAKTPTGSRPSSARCRCSAISAWNRSFTPSDREGPARLQPSMSELACSCDPDLPRLVEFTPDRGATACNRHPPVSQVYVTQED